MRVVLQRVKSAKVEVEENVVGEIKQGYLAYVGFCPRDQPIIIEKIINRILTLGLFEDAKGQMSLTLPEINGSILVIPQFTLYAIVKKGRKPSFHKAAPPTQAEELFDIFMKELRKKEKQTEQGVFGADMQVFSQNDGPVTIFLDSEELYPYLY